MESVRIERRKSNLNYAETHYDRRGRLFKAVLANSSLLESFFYELRFAAYIEENRIPLEGEPIINKLETDEYDQRSLKFLIYYKPLHLFLGGNRIILPDVSLPYAGLPTLERSQALQQIISPEEWVRTGEVSRFLISKARALISMQHIKTQNTKKEFKDIQEEKIITLFLTCSQACKEMGLNTLIFSLEKPLIRIIQKNDILITLTNEDIEHHGRRQTGTLNYEDARAYLADRNPALLEYYLSQPVSRNGFEVSGVN